MDDKINNFLDSLYQAMDPYEEKHHLNKMKCPICGKIFSRKNKALHYRSTSHLKKRQQLFDNIAALLIFKN